MGREICMKRKRWLEAMLRPPPQVAQLATSESCGLLRRST